MSCVWSASLLGLNVGHASLLALNIVVAFPVGFAAWNLISESGIRRVESGIFFLAVAVTDVVAVVFLGVAVRDILFCLFLYPPLLLCVFSVLLPVLVALRSLGISLGISQ